jgi:hypothetical protein
MGSEARARANRANASRSTGPRSAAGKARASANATRHGLTTAPAHSKVALWFHTITGLELSDALWMQENEVVQAGLALAEAEARLERAVDAEERFLRNLEEGGELALYLKSVRETETIWYSGPRSLKVKKCRHLVKEIWTNPFTYLDRLVRHRRTAEVARRKALRRWLTALDAQNSERTQFQS